MFAPVSGRRGVLAMLWALESAFASFSQKKTLAIFVAGLLPLVVRALLLPILPVPRPAIQDEFSYLLASDTFASGRLANPTPPLAEHFETMQELMRPVYASKYPPFSGLVMAAGQKLTGQPWVGVWLSMGLLCGVLCWALQGWLPSVWALGGSMLAVLHIGIVSYWTEGYWGGTCAAIGGALLIGAVPRLVERPRASMAVTFAAGLAILANTRPFEGLVFAVVCSAWLVFQWVRTKRLDSLVLKTAILPMALLLIPVGAWMGYYNYRLTGHALQLPYVAHDNQYALRTPLLWPVHEQPAPVYSNTFLRDFWQADRDAKLEAQHQILDGARVGSAGVCGIPDWLAARSVHLACGASAVARSGGEASAGSWFRGLPGSSVGHACISRTTPPPRPSWSTCSPHAAYAR